MSVSLNSSTSTSSTTNGKNLIASNKKRKIIIKPLQLAPIINSNSFEQKTWEKLKTAVWAILSPSESGFPFSEEELYQSVKDMCIQNLSESLFSKLRDECIKHVQTLFEFLHKKNQAIPDEITFLKTMEQVWITFCDRMITIRSIFLYLDRTFVMESTELKSLYSMGLELFSEHVMSSEELQSKTIKGIMHSIEQERKGELIDRQLVKTLIRMLHALQLYNECFVPTFLKGTQKFYEAEGDYLINEQKTSDFLATVDKRLKEETERCDFYVTEETKKQVFKILETHLISSHEESILSKGFSELMKDQKIDDLKLLFSLLSRVHKFNKISESMENYIQQTGSAIVNDKERDKMMVEELLKFKTKIDEVFETSFKKNKFLGDAIQKGFEKSINARKNKPAEFIAKHLDKLLKKGGTEEEVESQIERTLQIFHFVSGKDVFEEFYKNLLAKRLLLNTSASKEAEMNTISKLRVLCGNEFTEKLEGMFTDLETSNAFMESFKASPVSKQIPMETAISVLKKGNWPSYPDNATIKLPEEFLKVQDLFTKFYQETHDTHKLTWQYQLSQCTLKASFPSGDKELIVSLSQAVVLMVFNNGDEFSVADIQKGTDLELKEVRANLFSLALGKIDSKILNKKNSTVQKIADDETFAFNNEFASKSFRIRINQAQIKESKEEEEKAEENVFFERKTKIDAAIVRIMKARKKLGHQELVAEVLSQLRFPVDVKEIKLRIEDLMEREYISKSTEDSGEEEKTFYTYI